MIDGAKAQRKAIADVFGTRAPVQRCIRHKERNVCDHLGEQAAEIVKGRLRSAWAVEDHSIALQRLEVLERELARTHPSAAASLREGLEETVTLQRLGASERLRRTLASTNPIESMIEIVRRTRATSSAGAGRHAAALDGGGHIRGPSGSSGRSSATGTLRTYGRGRAGGAPLGALAAAGCEQREGGRDRYRLIVTSTGGR